MTEHVSQEKLIGLDVDAVRAEIRNNAYRGHTAGLAAGKLQANLVILPARYAEDFEEFCRLNPRPCPLVGKTRMGDPNWTELGDIDLRTDVPSFNIYRNGRLDSRQTDISDLWRDDMVGFALGCSFTFERALMAAGIRMPHVDADRTVPMFRTNIETVPSGPFGGEMVVSMRLIPDDLIAQTTDITARFPWAHGTPIHSGDPADIGISDIKVPDWGDPPVGAGTPVFWGCGVTPQNAVTRALLPLCITHTPGCMLITDVDDTENAFIT